MNVVLAHRKAERVIVEASLVNFRAKHLVSQNEKVDENHTEQSHEEVVAWSYRRKAIVQIVRNVTVTAQVLHKEEKVDIHPKAIPISVGMPQEEPSQVFEYDDGVVCEGCGLVWLTALDSDTHVRRLNHIHVVETVTYRQSQFARH